MSTNRDRVIVGIDGSPASLDAAQEGIRFAERFGWAITIICVWSWPAGYSYQPALPLAWDPSEDAEQILADALKVLKVPEGVTLTTETHYGDAGNVLIEASRTARLLVVGSTGAGMARTILLGSVSTKCAQRSECSVLVYRPQEPLEDDVAA